MNKTKKKILKLQERIKQLQDEMLNSLTKKTSNTREISVGDYQTKIRDLQMELSKLA